MRRDQLLTGLIALSSIVLFTHTAQARPCYGVRVGIGVYGPGPWYYGYPYPYYPPGYVVPVVGAAPVVVQPAPVTAQPASDAGTPPPPPAPPPPPPPARALTRVGVLLQQLSDPNETLRRDAVLELGRMRALRAVDPLMVMLARDSSPRVREAAARALGLIDAPRSLNALNNAAQADNDPEVRRSAQFASDAIRGNMRKY